MDWEKIKRSLRDGAALSMEKIEEYTKIGKLKIDELAARRKVDRNFADIGERVFDLVNENKGSSAESDLAVRKAIENVLQLREELASIAVRIKEIQDEANRGKTARPVSDDDEMTGI